MAHRPQQGLDRRTSQTRPCGNPLRRCALALAPPDTCRTRQEFYRCAACRRRSLRPTDNDRVHDKAEHRVPGYPRVHASECPQQFDQFVHGHASIFLRGVHTASRSMPRAYTANVLPDGKTELGGKDVRRVAALTARGSWPPGHAEPRHAVESCTWPAAGPVAHGRSWRVCGPRIQGRGTLRRRGNEWTPATRVHGDALPPLPSGCLHRASACVRYPAVTGVQTCRLSVVQCNTTTLRRLSTPSTWRARASWHGHERARTLRFVDTSTNPLIVYVCTPLMDKEFAGQSGREDARYGHG